MNAIFHCSPIRLPIAIAFSLLVACFANAQDRTEITWTTVGEADWQFVDGEVRAVAGESAGYLISQGQYANFRLIVEFLPDDTVNSGVFIHCQDSTEITPLNCYEINIWDRHPNRDFRTGAIVTRAFPPLAEVDTIGKWNRYEIEAVDGRINVHLNGVQTARLDEETLTDGFIALQCAAGGEVRFHNISIEVN